MIKKQYNQLLNRYKQAEIYMDNQAISIKQREIYVPELKKITDRLGKMLEVIGEHTQDEALNGFAYEEEESACN